MKYPGRRSAFVWLVGALAALLVPATVTAQSNTTGGPTSSDAGGFHGWQFDGHVGGAFAGTTTGTSMLPAPLGSFTTFQGLASRFVPSWYFGDGALLANQVAQAIVNQPPPPITPLDPVLTTGSASWQTGLGFGVRIGHAITRHALGEFNVDGTRGHMAISSSALTAIDATRASFQTYFTSILERNPNAANVSTQSTSTIVNDSGKQLMMTGDVAITPGSYGGFVPYGTIGGGILLPQGTLPSVTLVGTYAFTQNSPGSIFNGARVQQTDNVLVQYNPRAKLLLLVGGGVQRDVTARSGLRIDARFYPQATDMTVRVDTQPMTVFTTPPGRIVRGPGPQIQISTFPPAPSSLSQPVGHVDTFTGTGAQSTVTVGYYVRF